MPTRPDQTAKELRGSEERYRLLDSLPTGVVVHDADTAIVFANVQACDLLGFSAAELLGKRSEDPQWRFLREDGTTMPVAEYPAQRVVRTGRAVQGLVVGVLRPGASEPRWGLVNAFPDRDAGGLREVIVTFIDVTAQKRAEDDLRERLVLETLLADLAARFVNLDPRNLDPEIRDALRRLCECLDIDIGGIWQVADGDPSTLVMTHGHRHRDGPPIPRDMKAADHFPWVEAQLRATRRSLMMPDTAALPPEAARDREFYGRFGIESALCVPAFGADGALRAVVACNCLSRRPWPPVLVGRVEMLAHIILMAIDRARAERTAAADRARTRLLNEMLDAAPAGVIVHDRAGTLLYANQYAAELHGWPSSSFLQNTLGDLVPAEARELIPARLREVEEHGASVFEVEHLRRDGSRVSLRVAARLVDWLGQPAILSVETDLTDRRQAEETLRVSEEKFRTAFMTSLDAIYIATLEEGRIVDCNEHFIGVFGYTREEVQGKTSVELGLYDDPADRARMVAALKDKGFVRELEVWGRKKSGAKFLASLSISFLRMGDVPHILGIVRDVTHRERARTEQVKLEHQLLQAQKMESIGRLAGGVAHDFNNMLSVILSYAEFAIDGLGEGDPMRSDLEEVKRAGERAVTLTRQLLAFSRKQILEPEALDLNHVVSGIEKMLRRLLGEDIAIDVRLAEGLGTVMADPGQLEQLIMNLVVNARDAMPQGGTLTLQTANVELSEGETGPHGAVRQGRYAMLAVRDTGCGMDAATQERIFEPFFTTKETGKGTGLGLSTVFGIVKQSGGDITFDSEVGRGTTFRVYLPRVDAVASDTSSKTAPVATTGSETVLIVEDEGAVRRIAERILRSAGYEVLTASSGGDALILCEKHRGPIQLLLTDVIMPQMSGQELAERLTRVMPGLKVVYMSGYTDDAIVEHGALAPGTRFIGKPFAAAELTRKVREALDEV